MNIKQKKTKPKSDPGNVWLLISVLTAALLLTYYIYVENLVSNKPLGSASNGHYSTEWLYVIWLGLTFIIPPLFSIFKTKGLNRILSILCLIVIVGLILSASFSYSLGSLTF